MSRYFAFVRSHPRFLGFGFLTAMSSCVGQTWFISLFSTDIRATFNLSHGEFGEIYSLGTLASGVCIVWVGRLIDSVALRIYTAAAFVALVSACIGMSVAGSVAALGLVLFMLRLAGQAVMTHIATTSMARHFEADRGKAISIGAMGFSAAEAVLPLSIVTLTTALGWRSAWAAAAALLALVLLPSALWLSGAASATPARRPVPAADPVPAGRVTVTDWTRAQVLRDPLFYLVLPALLVLPIISTGIIFHQVHLVASKGWALAWFAACFGGYAFTKVAATLLVGPAIDRYSATRLFPFFVPPIAIGLFALGSFDHPLIALVYLCLSGVSTGFGVPLTGAFWAELYGVAHLGAIRSLGVSIMVFGSAASPAAFGWLIDRGVAMTTLANASGIFATGAMVLAWMALRRSHRRPLAGAPEMDVSPTDDG